MIRNIPVTYDPNGAGAGEVDWGRSVEEEGRAHKYGLFYTNERG